MKTYFKPKRSKQAKDVIFSRKVSIQSHSILTFHSSPVIKTIHHKHMELNLDEKLNFKELQKQKMSKAHKSIAVLKRLQDITPRIFY